jgi:hypothetical protein
MAKRKRITCPYCKERADMVTHAKGGKYVSIAHKASCPLINAVYDPRSPVPREGLPRADDRHQPRDGDSASPLMERFSGKRSITSLKADSWFRLLSLLVQPR